MPEAESRLEWGQGQGASIAEAGCILRTVVGSQLHGLTNEGTDDRDEMAIVVEPPERALGLKRFEHHSHRTQPEGVPSGPGDLDLICYSLRKWVGLALKGSPTVLLPLFAPPEQTLICTDGGHQLREMTEQIVLAIQPPLAFLGYLEAQREELIKGKVRERERSHNFGYDTKYAMHALRVGYQGLELARESRITLPVPEPERSHLMEVRRGAVPLPEILEELDELIGKLKSTPVSVQIPEPSLMIEQWLVETYLESWRDWQPTMFE